LLSRHSGGTINWRFRQPLPVLIWLREGIHGLRLDVAGSDVEAAISATDRGLCFVPSGVAIDGQFSVDTVCNYAMVFLNPGLLAARGIEVPTKPMMAFEHEAMTSGLRDLAELASYPDDLFTLCLDGWAMQSLGQLSLLAGSADRPSGSIEGLPAASLRRVQEHIRTQLARPLTIDELAGIAGFSRRHFIRAFHRSVGQTPLRYVRTLRLENATHRIVEGERSLTEIAGECGFSTVHHLSSCFRRATGMSPSQYRRHHCA
jgi:AraC family transcriptional regulator